MATAKVPAISFPAQPSNLPLTITAEQISKYAEISSLASETASIAEALRFYRAVTGDHRSPLDLPPAVLSRLLLQAHKLGRCAIVQPSLSKRVGLRLRALCFLITRCAQMKRQSRIELFFGHGEGFDE